MQADITNKSLLRHIVLAAVTSSEALDRKPRDIAEHLVTTGKLLTRPG